MSSVSSYRIFRLLAGVALAAALFPCGAGAQTAGGGVTQASSVRATYQAAAPADFGNNIGYGHKGSLLGNLDEGLFSQVPIHLTTSIREGYDSNVFTTQTNPQSSFYTNWAAGANYNFGGPRLQLSSSLNGGVTYYYTRPGDSIDLNGALGMVANYLVTPRLTLGFTTTTAYLSQPDLTISGGTNRENGDYFITNTGITANFQLTPIFSTTTGYNFNAIYYIDSNLNSNQGNISQSFSESFNWLWKPTTTLFLIYTANPTSYYSTDLNSFANYLAVGFTQTLNPRSTWTARLGAQVNFNSNPVDGQSIYIGPYGETTLNYKFGPASSIYLTMRYGTEASGLNDVTQRQTFRVSLGVAHNFNPRLSASFGMNYQCNFYSQSGVINSFLENVLDTTLTVNYQLSRLLSVSAGYQFTIDDAPNASFRDYTRNVIFAGVNFAF